MNSECDKCNKCIFCGLITETRMHHLIPKSKGGTETVETCEVCENFIHRSWSNKQLRDFYNSVDVILADEGFQRFLRWRKKQPVTTLFKSNRGRNRDKNKYH